MSKKIICMWIALCLLASNSFALSESEWQNLYNTSTIFRQSEQALTKAWNDKYKSLPESPQKKAMLEEQRSWLKSGRDASASDYMRQGMDYAQAYTQATFDRVGFLKGYAGKQNQTPAHKSSTRQEPEIEEMPFAQTTEARQPSSQAQQMPFAQQATPQPTPARQQSQPMQPAQATESPLHSSPNRVTVEAEGSGTTKMEALRVAWMEAVRNAVGMFMSGNTRLTDDKIAEEIAIYSRGQVNSYQIISESQNNNLWQIRIRANIDKDVLQETAKTTKSQTIDLSKSNDFASALSAREAKKDGIRMFESAWNSTDWSSCIDYAMKIINNGNKIYVVHKIIVNFDNYAKIAHNFAAILKIIAVKVRRETPEIATKIIRSNSDHVNSIRKDFVETRNLFNSKNTIAQDFSRIFENRHNFYIKNANINYRLKRNEVAIMTSIGEILIFELNPDDLKRIHHMLQKRYILNFKIETGEGFDSMIASGNSNEIKLFGGPGGNDIILPYMSIGGGNTFIYCEYIQNIDLTKDELLNIKTLTGKYTIEPVQ